MDLARRVLTLKIAEPQPREIDVAVADGEEGTRITSMGRVRRLEDLRTGERLFVVCSDDAGTHRARSIKIGPSRYAVPTPRKEAP